MATRLGDLLDDARRRTFVGRRRELASFDDVLLGRSARRVLLVHGPGGIGKTTLLLEYRTRARAKGRTVLLLAASLADENLTREYLSVAMLLSRADEVFAQPGMAERVMRLGAHAPRYPLPGPSRRELLAAIAD